MQLNDLFHPIFIPLFPLLAGLLTRFLKIADPRLVITASLLATATALIDSFFGQATSGGWFQLDFLATTMAVLVSALGAVILRFAGRYLEGDPNRTRFLSWMSLTIGAVLTLVISNHLLLLLGSWIATSLGLHRLLLHHPDRPGAIFAARKKAVFSRLAELSLLAAALLLYSGHQTWHLDELSASITAGNHAGLPVAAFLLVFTAALKSAQFPFHSWLPDTMDTPTPVSAFMHAGIINAGGFLILRLAPVFTAAPSALYLLATIGTFTAVFGAIVMLAQPAVKRSLAFSTIAQMGFMMIQCGLGAWGLALLHLVAHSLYKANAFLRAGSNVRATPRAAVPLSTPALLISLLAGLLLVALVATALTQILPLTHQSPTVFLVIIAFALSYGMGRTWSGSPASLPRALASASVVAVVACLLHLLAGSAFNPAPPPPTPTWLSVLVALAFGLLFLFQALLWRAAHHPLGRRLYVHALNGFYVGPLANRFLHRLWPARAQL